MCAWRTWFETSESHYAQPALRLYLLVRVVEEEEDQVEAAQQGGGDGDVHGEALRHVVLSARVAGGDHHGPRVERRDDPRLRHREPLLLHRLRRTARSGSLRGWWRDRAREWS